MDVERPGSIVVDERRSLFPVGGLEVVYCIGVAAYLWDVGTVQGEVAIAVRHQAAGNRIEDAEDEDRVLGVGLGVLAARIAPGDESQTNWGRSASCKTPHFPGVGIHSPLDTTSAYPPDRLFR